MKTLYLILLIIAAVCFAIAVVVPAPVAGSTPGPMSRINLVAVGLLSWVLVPLIQQADRMND